MKIDVRDRFDPCESNAVEYEFSISGKKCVKIRVFTTLTKGSEVIERIVSLFLVTQFFSPHQKTPQSSYIEPCRIVVKGKAATSHMKIKVIDAPTSDQPESELFELFKEDLNKLKDSYNDQFYKKPFPFYKTQEITYSLKSIQKRKTEVPRTKKQKSMSVST